MTVLNLPAGTQIITEEVVDNALATQGLNKQTITEIVIPESVKEIGRSAFSVCRSLTTIVLHDGIRQIGSWAFSYCASLSSIVIPENVTEIGEYAFSYCTSLSSIVIPENVTEIDGYAFKGCESLTTVTLHDGVTKIDCWAFRECTNLSSIIIPDSVTIIGERAFEGCINLKTIYVSDMLRDKGKDYWAQKGIDTDSVTLMRHSEIKTWVKQQGLCVSYNIHNQIALYEVCQRQFNQEQIPDIFFEISYADLIKLTGYHNNALLLKIPRTLNRLDDINYTELCLFKRRNSISTIPLKLFEFLTIKEVYNVLKAHLPSAKNETVEVIKAK